MPVVVCIYTSRHSSELVSIRNISIILEPFIQNQYIQHSADSPQSLCAPANKRPESTSLISRGKEDGFSVKFHPLPIREPAPPFENLKSEVL